MKKEMTQEEKELLLKDLCARLPYGVMAQYTFSDGSIEIGELEFIIKEEAHCSWGVCDIDDNFKPYLRPLSSMTEEEEIEYDATFATIKIADGHYDSTMTYKSFDFLNAHHFDFRNLIERGLAIEVTENNNPYYKE